MHSNPFLLYLLTEQPAGTVLTKTGCRSTRQAKKGLVNECITKPVLEVLSVFQRIQREVFV